MVYIIKILHTLLKCGTTRHPASINVSRRILAPPQALTCHVSCATGGPVAPSVTPCPRHHTSRYDVTRHVVTSRPGRGEDVSRDGTAASDGRRLSFAAGVSSGAWLEMFNGKLTGLIWRSRSGQCLHSMSPSLDNIKLLSVDNTCKINI